MCAALWLGCQGQVGPATGDNTVVGQTPLCAASDPGNVVAPQRVALITSTQLMNMIRLVHADAAKAVVDGRIFPVVDDLTLRFPPPRVEQYKSILNRDELSPFDNTAQAVGAYVRDNFAAVTKCASATDDCATGFLNALAKRAYRRPLTAPEQERFTALFSTLRSQEVNGYQVTTSVEEATGNAVYALFMTPQLLWRWEMGAQASSSPPGVYLTDGELASNLSFFLTDRPPDDMLLADVTAGTLRQNLAAHTNRILATPESRAWLTHVMQTYFFLNQLPAIVIDEQKFPIVAGGALFSDLVVESKMFLDDVMWNGKVMDLITSRKAFVNTNLATMIYNVPVPAGATATTFVATTLPAEQRAGILTDAGFITTRARSTGTGVVPRGLAVKALFTCLETPGPPDSINMPDGPVDQQRKKLDTLTAQEQVQFRIDTPPCNSCHPSFDPYGLVLEWYDVVGRFRQLDDLEKPVDGHTTLPDVIGGKTVQSAVELADELSKSDVFTNCMSKSMLQYALLDTAVELPLPKAKVPGCAAAGIANELRKSGKQSFTDLTVAIATSPAFSVRKQVQ